MWGERFALMDMPDQSDQTVRYTQRGGVGRKDGVMYREGK
jgi:hypothetical protein